MLHVGFNSMIQWFHALFEFPSAHGMGSYGKTNHELPVNGTWKLGGGGGGGGGDTRGTQSFLLSQQFSTHTLCMVFFGQAIS